MEKFHIDVPFEGKKLHLHVEMIDIQLNYYRFKVTAKNTYLILENNAPKSLRKGGSGRNLNPDWKLVEGKAKPEILKPICDEIDKYYKAKKW